MTVPTRYDCIVLTEFLIATAYYNSVGIPAPFGKFNISFGYSGFRQISTYPIKVPTKRCSNSGPCRRYRCLKLASRETFFDTFWRQKPVRINRIPIIIIQFLQCYGEGKFLCCVSTGKLIFATDIMHRFHVTIEIRSGRNIIWNAWIRHVPVLERPLSEDQVLEQYRDAVTLKRLSRKHVTFISG